MDALTLSAHKIYGPKGIGALYLRNALNLAKDIKPLITGDDRECGLRAGTENTPYIVGFAEAVKINEKIRIKESRRIGLLRDYFWRELKKIVPTVMVNGSMKNPFPNNFNI